MDREVCQDAVFLLLVVVELRQGLFITVWLFHHCVAFLSPCAFRHIVISSYCLVTTENVAGINFLLYIVETTVVAVGDDGG